jgi:hypothetical protein
VPTLEIRQRLCFEFRIELEQLLGGRAGNLGAPGVGRSGRYDGLGNRPVVRVDLQSESQGIGDSSLAFCASGKPCAAAPVTASRKPPCASA